MDGYRFQLRCRHCGGECAHVTGGQFTSFDAQAIARCAECHTDWLVRVELLDPGDGGQAGFARGGVAKARAKWHRA